MPTLDPETGKPLSGAQKRAMKAAKAAEAAKHEETWPDVFLAAYTLGGGRVEAAKQAGVSLAKFRARLDADDAFKSSFEDARLAYVEWLEKQLVLVGTGKIRGNPLALMMRLKAEAPEKYHDKAQVEATVKVQRDSLPMPPAELDALLARMARVALPALPDLNVVEGEIVRKDDA